MVGYLIRKEILDHILSFRFLILSIVGAIVIWLSLYSGYAYYQARLKDYRLAQAATETRIHQIRVDEQSEYDRVGYLVHKSPTPMCIFVRGLDPTLGRSGTTGWMEITARLKWSPAEAKPFLGVFPPLDLGLVVQVVLSLFVLLFTYDAVCGEKEAGTLRLAASYSMPKHHLLLGKFFGALVLMLTAFGLPLLLGIAAVLLAPEVQFTDSELGRLGLVLVAFGLYLTVFICAGLLSSSLTHRAATSFVLLLAFWVVTTSVLPRLSLIVAEGVRPAPSVYELQAEKEAIHKSTSEVRREVRSRWRQEHSQPGQEWWKTPEGREAHALYNREALLKSIEARDSQWDRLDEAFRNRYNARLALAVALARFSPAFAFKNVAVLLAGTGVDRHRRFFTAYRVHRNRYLNDWFIDLYYRNQLKRDHPAKYGEYRWDASDIPLFTYRENWPGEEARSALIDVGVLAMWGLIFFVGAYVVMLRYDVR